MHICTLAISLVMVARRGWPTDEGHTVGRFVANCLLIQAWDYDFRLSWNYPSWSISSEWFAYLLFPAIAATSAGLGRRTAAALVIVAFVLSIFVYSNENQVKFRGLAIVLPTFVGGVCLAIARPPGDSTARPRPWAELGLLAAVILPFVVAPGPLRVALYFALFFAMVGYLGAIHDRSAGFWRSRPLLYLGDISYSLYMTHAIVISLIARMIRFDALRWQARSVRIAALVGCSILILGAASAMYHAVERPLRDLSRRRRATAAAGASPPIPRRDATC